MVQTIAALYSDNAHAESALAELKQGGHIVQSTARLTSTPTEDTELIDGGISKYDAAAFAEGLRNGGSVLTVEPLFGRGWATEKILQAHGPIYPGLRTYVEYIHDWSAPAPLSAWLGLKVLSDEPAPLSAKLGWSVLSDKPTPLSAKFGWRVLFDEPAPLSTKLNWPVLSDNPTPLSTKLGWRVLSDNPFPLSTRFGWKLLLDVAAPLSAKFNWAVLSDNPTPLSSWLKLPVLTEKKSFFY